MEASEEKNIKKEPKTEEIIPEGIIPKAEDIQPLDQTKLKHKVKCFCKIISKTLFTLYQIIIFL